MTRKTASLCFLLALALCLAAAAAAVPNVVIFVADDVDWRDFGFMGNDAIQTPNLDRLAAGGLTFTHAFLTTPQCSPTRISVLTGKYPHATGAEDLHMPLPAGERMLPSYLEAAGYFTGHMLKTHYGPNGIAQFDWYEDDVAKFPDFLTAAGDRPFFMWVGFRDAHRGYQPGAFDPPHDPAKVRVPPYLSDDDATRRDLAMYYDEVARMDKNIGKMIAALKARGVFENTVVIFFSDNGMPFPRAKGTLYDSGIGTPLLVSWPGEIEAGSVHRGLASVIDLAPTVLEICGLSPEDVAPKMQGSSMLDRLRDPARPGRRYIFAERNWHNCDEHMRSVRTKRFKLIRNAYLELPHGTPADLGRSPSFKSLLALKELGNLTAAQAQLFQVPRPLFELYNLEEDPWETRNLAAEEGSAVVLAELMLRLEDWGETTGDFSPEVRRRGDNTDRYTGVKFMQGIPPMTHLQPE